MAFCEELKKYKDTVDCGEGMAKLLLWTYWEDLYDYWKIRSGDSQDLSGLDQDDLYDWESTGAE